MQPPSPRPQKHNIAGYFIVWAVLHQVLFIASLMVGALYYFDLDPLMGEQDVTSRLIGNLVGWLGSPLFTTAILLRWGMRIGISTRFFITSTALAFTIYILNPIGYVIKPIWDGGGPTLLFLFVSTLFAILTQVFSLAFDQAPRRFAPLLVIYVLTVGLIALVRPYVTWFSSFVELMQPM